LGVLQQPSLPDGTIRDTVAAVFRQRRYDRTIHDSILDRVFAWLGRLLSEEFRYVANSPVAKWTLFIVLIAIIIGIIMHLLLARVGDGGHAAQRSRGAGRGERSADPWAEAQRLAADGNYTDAAHELYRALIQSVARREQLRIDPAKTTGDYVRDLRRRSSALVAPFRDFARTYEVVVYGLGVCDQPRYERLLSLASAIGVAGDHG
jgi:hypothetical protein